MPIVKGIVNTFFKEGTKAREWASNFLRPPSPREVQRNYRQIGGESQERLRHVLVSSFFTDPLYYPDPPEVYLSTAVGQKDLSDHMFGRLESFRSSVIPWLHSAISLKEMHILEIGCGTGASTVALAEQGAQVFGLDVNERAVSVGRTRCELYGLDATLTCGNAADLPTLIGERQFDAIIYFAVLEHMTWQERQASLTAAWNHLLPGQFLVVIETPNRLWYIDDHTSGEHFFHWIPDEAAIAYSRFTKREIYNRTFDGHAGDAERELLARWGRGVSFHDFVLAFDLPLDKLPVQSCLSQYEQQGLAKLRGHNEYERFLRRISPNLHPAFRSSYLDVVFRKT